MEKVPKLNWAIAKAIKTTRESKQLTQGQLAGFAGLSEVYLSKMELGSRGDSINALVLLAQALGLRPSALMQIIEENLAGETPQPQPTRGRPCKR